MSDTSKDYSTSPQAIVYGSGDILTSSTFNNNASGSGSMPSFEKRIRFYLSQNATKMQIKIYSEPRDRCNPCGPSGGDTCWPGYYYPSSGIGSAGYGGFYGALSFQITSFKRN
ncbi:hypothetical protein [Flavobacterium sp.]|jgi:hypothetical protein|uniref:hypothetical protein n=1 Tax=Flavobacterium sp. TaxID=239 RepID=UPI0037C05216